MALSFAAATVERMEVEVNPAAKNMVIQEYGSLRFGSRCRQRKTELAVLSKMVKAKGPCTVQLCHSCLKNRIGNTLTPEAVAQKCTKCLGKCNCSICYNKAGLIPTGIRMHKAKKKGYQSVADMLRVEKLQKKENGDGKDGKGRMHVASDKREDVNSDAAKPGELMGTCNDSRDDAAAAVNDDDAKAKAKAARGRCRVKECHVESREVELPLPQGTPLTTVAGVKLAAEDVGNTLQFFKFCETFRELFKIEKSQAQSVLRELSRGGSGRSGRPGQYSSVVRFRSYMLFFIQKGLLQESLEQASNNWSWFQDLAKLVSASGVSKVDPVMKELPAECFIGSREGYNALNFSQKLRLLNFICDEALNTKTLRGWIEEQNERSVQCKGDMKAKVALAKDKERDIQAKLQEQMAKRATPDNGDAVPISESDSIASVLYELLHGKADHNYFVTGNVNFKMRIKSLTVRSTYLLYSFPKILLLLFCSSLTLEKDLEAKLQEEIAKRTTANSGDAVQLSESDSIVSQITSEAARAHMEVLEAEIAMLPEKAVRIQPYVVDADGYALWKLKGDFGEDILLQDTGTWDGAPSVENWFFTVLK
ncbi:uncharacterized protein LOC103947815 [Pyrus x bretschneideri]|uniref:uncharacterized protein LOC103947815 n=1 Tax=Pyrus x bretschneideri TaxID=225117 RepID=UPI00202FEAEF|nr:uncharacterized protein LOC103947815 [Pyrus x bretschneideri]